MIRLIAIISYIFQLHRIAYFINRNRKRIITFHNVLTDDVFVNNIANGVSCSFSQFKAIIDEISKFYSFSLDLDDTKTVTITFDDGYSNQVSVAAPYLISKGIPAYLFVSGKLLYDSDEKEVMNGSDALIVDLLLHWVAYVPNGCYTIDYKGESYKFCMTDYNRSEIWSTQIWRAFLFDAKAKGEDLLMALDKVYPISKMLSSLSEKYVKQRLIGVSSEELTALTNKGWSVGWHTFSHYPLSQLSFEEKRKEIMHNTLIMGEVFSFPYGGLSEVDEQCIKIVSQSGYKSAVSNVNISSNLMSNWFRSRMSVSSDRIMLHFELSGLKHMIKYHKLLPKY